MPEKIVQIIPAIPGIFARYIGNGNDDQDVFDSPIVCFALIEEKQDDGSVLQHIIPMDMSADGIIEESDAVDFILPSPKQN